MGAGRQLHDREDSFFSTASGGLPRRWVRGWRRGRGQQWCRRRGRSGLEEEKPEGIGGAKRAGDWAAVG
jgi:hypothetical protein